MEKILISACLLGEKVRYHGGDAIIQHSLLEQWQKEGRIISLCPEVSAGFPTPRPPSEIIGSGGGQSVLDQKAKVMKRDGSDYSSLFIQGAQNALSLVQKHSIKVAVLKEGSPSCGSAQIYDGSFTGKKMEGQGVTAALLSSHGIAVFSEFQLESVQKFLDRLENR